MYTEFNAGNIYIYIRYLIAKFRYSRPRGFVGNGFLKCYSSIFLVIKNLGFFQFRMKIVIRPKKERNRYQYLYLP